MSGPLLFVRAGGHAPDVKGKKAPDWIFVQFRPKVEVVITTPVISDRLVPESILKVEALARDASTPAPTWTVKWGTTPVQTLGTGWSLETQVPWTDEELTGELTLSTTVGGKLFIKTQSLQVENHSELRLTLPRNRLIVSGQTWDLKPQAQDAGGVAMTNPTITYSGRFEHEPWVPLVVTGGVMTAPTRRGEWTLKAVLDLGNGHIKTTTTELKLVKRLPRIEVSRENDHGDNWTRDQDRHWRFTSGEGRFNLRIGLSTPWRGPGVPQVTVNGQKMNLTKDKDTWITRIRTREKLEVETSFDIATMTLEEAGE